MRWVTVVGGGGVVDAGGQGSLVVDDVELVAAVGPRDEDDRALLRVEREILDVERARGLDERRVQPQHHQ